MDGRVPLRGIIGLPERKATDAVSGYMHLQEYCDQNNLEFISMDNYSFNKEGDKEKLLKLKVDLVFILGWQRLVPDWFIEHCAHGVIGVHGSTQGITAGRGRSPQNWALIMGGRQFEVSLFRVDSGIDSGDVLATRRFPYDEFDDIKTSYYKVSWATSEMLVSCYENGVFESNEGKPQASDAKYLPQRKPEDGMIDWNLEANVIDRFVKALTRPYPGAETKLKGHSIKIWRGRPVNLEGIADHFEPGEVIAVCPNNDIFVMCANRAFLIEDWSSDYSGTIHKRDSFSSVDFAAQMDQIISRHSEKLPNLPLADDILNLAKMKMERK